MKTIVRVTRQITLELLVHATNTSIGKHEHLEQYLQRITHLMLNGDPESSHIGVIQRIENLSLCSNLQVLYLYDNAIKEIENLDYNIQLRHVHLQNNAIQEIKNLSNLIHLQKIYLDSNYIYQLQGLNTCSKLEELHLSNQQHDKTSFQFDLITLDALSQSLRVLMLANVCVTSIVPLFKLRQLQILDLSKNQITALEEVFGLLHALANTLMDLNLIANPVTKMSKYREKVVAFSSSTLQILDTREIDKNQRRMMQLHMAHKHKQYIVLKTGTSANSKTIENDATRLKSNNSHNKIIMAMEPVAIKLRRPSNQKT